MQFFKYDPIFLNWLITYAGNRPILDIGCGEGHLLRDLLARTPRCHGTEVRYITDEDVAPHVTVSNQGVFPVRRKQSERMGEVDVYPFAQEAGQ